MSREGESLKKEKVKKIKIIAKFYALEVLSLAFIITGIVLLSVYDETIGYEIVEDYTDCLDYEDKIKCKDVLLRKNKCTCFIPLNITQQMNKNVIAYYELDHYDQSITQSKDDQQWSGTLPSEPSKNCGKYSYVETKEGRKPIAPCGALADSMFNDTFSLQIDNEYMKYIRTGLIPEAEKSLYRNPPGDLAQAFEIFSKPINWDRNIWELDTSNPDNNGFKNEAFIAWMKTDWTRKPVWRVNHTGVYQHGVPKGSYILRVIYAYPPSRYSGRRKFMIGNIQHVVNPLKLGFGIVFLVLGIIIIIGKLFFNRKKYYKYFPCEQNITAS